MFSRKRNNLRNPKMVEIGDIMFMLRAINFIRNIIDGLFCIA